LATFFYIDEVVSDETGVRPKHYEQIVQLFREYFESTVKGKKPEEYPEPLQIIVYYTDDLKEACIEANIELDKVIKLPKGVVKVGEKPSRFTR
jgi:hypothetical protein